MLGGAVFHKHLAQDLGLMFIACLHQPGENLLLFLAQEVSMRMVPVRDLYATAVPSQGYQGVIDREDGDVCADRAVGNTQFRR